MTWDYKLALITHIFSAIVWVGGVLFIAIIAVPLLKHLKPEARHRLMTLLGERFRTVGWTALSLLIISGSYMIYKWGARWDTVLDGSFFTSPHTSLLGQKLLVVLAMLIISGIHDFYLGPLAAQPGHSPQTREKFRRYASLLGRATGICVIVIVTLAIFVARPWA